jgi:integrase
MKSDKNVTFDVVQSWIDNVAYSHSHSIETGMKYRRTINRFCEFIGKAPGDILKEYESSGDREFKRKFAMYVRGFIGYLMQHGYCNNTIKSIVAEIKSFFKYNDLPLAYIPLARAQVIHHNRDITREEIVEVLKIVRPRDRAFFCIMSQTGLRPHTICELRLKHIQPDFDSGAIPCKIDVPEDITKGAYRSYFTFMGAESVKHLKDYLNTRPNLAPESYLFTMHGTEKKADSKSISHRFREAIIKLNRKGIVDYQQKAKAKPGTVRLYSLRKFFRKYANQAGFEFVQFWMGHIVNQGQEEHYRPTDVEFHRELYKEKAMPYLRLEKATPTEIEKVIMERDQQIEMLRKELEEEKAKRLEQQKVANNDMAHFKTEVLSTIGMLKERVDARVNREDILSSVFAAVDEKGNIVDVAKKRKEQRALYAKKLQEKMENAKRKVEKQQKET